MPHRITADNNFFAEAWNFALNSAQGAMAYIIDAIKNRDFYALIPLQLAFIIIIALIVLFACKSKKPYKPKKPRRSAGTRAPARASADDDIDFEALPKSRRRVENLATVMSSRLLMESDGMGKDVTFDFLQDYLSEAGEVAGKMCGLLSVAADGSLSAAWGVDSTTGDEAHDALNALRAALLLRMYLIEKNNKQIAAPENAADQAANNKRRIFQIFGISTGKLIKSQAAGGGGLIVGEPSVLALKARETAVKFGADIVITAKTWRLIDRYIITEEIDPLPDGNKVVRLFAVINLRVKKDETQSLPKNLKELRSLLSTGLM
jgi:hypothetical protein